MWRTRARPVHPTAQAVRRVQGDPAGTPAPLARELAGAESGVAQGVAPVSASMSEALRAAVTEGSHQAFVNGLHTSLTITGVLCVIGALVAVRYVRRSQVPVDIPAAH
ncbi:hypothetical protein ACIBF6_35515 [Streptosporangium amethystogenes]|uniref:hypothetical protein n=1 Tax=Streptosporangium amethystogenes TaxID=2002 RepID=UPI0037BCB72B